ncbi:FecR domain-containing protein [Candidatus Omnitrophota bacterium]
MQILKNQKIIFSLLFALILSLLMTDAEAAGRTGKIVVLKGTAKIRVPYATDWVPAKAGKLLTEGDIFKTAEKSSAIINLGEGEFKATVVVGENSQLLLLKLSTDEETGTQKTLLDLAMGRITITILKPEDVKPIFEVKTPTSMVEVGEGSLSVSVEASK